MRPTALAAAAAATLTVLPLSVPHAAMAQEALEVSLPYETFTLDNGLRVVVHEDRKAPVVAVQVMYDVGSKNEPEGKTGFAHLFEHLMFNGSENFDDDFFVALKDMGATQYNGTTSTDRTNYYETVPTGALDRILFLESDRMGHLLGAVTQEKLDNQIGVVQNEKRVGEDRPFGTRIFEAIYANLYPEGHPYHHMTIGSMEDLEAASLEDVKEWFRQYYGAANAVLVLAGDIDAEEAKPLVQKYFGSIDPGPALMQPGTDAPKLDRVKRATFEDRIAQPRQYRVFVGPPTGTEDAPRLDLAMRTLVGGKTSRLYRRLVDELEIANGVSGYYSESMLSGAIFFIVDAKSEDDLPRINRVIDEEIAEFLRRGPTRDELERAKTIYLSSEIRGLESVSGKAATLARGTLFMDDPDFYSSENLDTMQAASAEDVRDTAREWLDAGYFDLQVLPYPDHAASGQDVDRAAGLPEIGHPGQLTFPDYSEATLSNGIRVVVAPRPTVPVVEVALSFDAGTATGNIPVGDNEAALPGLAGMATSLMDEGTRRRTAQEIAAESEALGAQVAIYNTRDDSKAYLSALKTHLGDSLALLSDIVRNPSFPEEEVERFRARTIDGLEQEKANPQALGARALRAAIYGPDHPYGNVTTTQEAIAAIEAIERDDLSAWVNAWLRPDNATIYVSGDTTEDEIVPALEKVFGSWRASGEAPQKSVTDAPERTGPRVVVIDKPDTAQSLILAGRTIAPTGGQQDTAIAAMNDVFGGSFLSRINMNLREEKGWSYGVGSGAGDARGQRLFYVMAPVQTDKTGASITELLNEMAAYTGAEPPTEQELRRTVAGVVGGAPGKFETAEAVLFAMMSNANYGRPLDYDVGEASRYLSLSTDDLSSVAADIIDPEAMTWIIVGDWSKIEDEVRALDLGEIEVRKAG